MGWFLPIVELPTKIFTNFFDKLFFTNSSFFKRFWFWTGIILLSRKKVYLFLCSFSKLFFAFINFLKKLESKLEFFGIREKHPIFWNVFFVNAQKFFINAFKIKYKNLEIINDEKIYVTKKIILIYTPKKYLAYRLKKYFNLLYPCFIYP